MSDCCLPGSHTSNREFDNLIGSCGIRTQPFVVLAGIYQEGEVLYKTGTPGQLVNKTTAGTVDDAEAIAIMPFTVTLNADDEMAVYVEGEFNKDKVTGFNDLAAVSETLTLTSIRLREFSY